MKIAITSLAALLAMPALAEPATITSGEKAWVQCRACHTIEKGAANKIGPNLFGVVGRSAGRLEGFNYSPALKGSGLVWDRATLDRWVTRPNAVLKGHRMVFIGIPDAERRTALIDYLASQAP